MRRRPSPPRSPRIHRSTEYEYVERDFLQRPRERPAKDRYNLLEEIQLPRPNAGIASDTSIPRSKEKPSITNRSTRSDAGIASRESGAVAEAENLEKDWQKQGK
jgi:hypothetical protein